MRTRSLRVLLYRNDVLSLSIQVLIGAMPFSIWRKPHSQNIMPNNNGSSKDAKPKRPRRQGNHEDGPNQQRDHAPKTETIREIDRDELEEGGRCYEEARRRQDHPHVKGLGPSAQVAKHRPAMTKKVAFSGIRGTPVLKQDGGRHRTDVDKVYQKGGKF